MEMSDEKFTVQYGYAVYRPEVQVRLERGKISAYGWFLIIGGWALCIGVAVTLIALVIAGVLPWKPFVVAFVVGLLFFRR
jgi:hypothetical protein